MEVGIGVGEVGKYEGEKRLGVGWRRNEVERRLCGEVGR